MSRLSYAAPAEQGFSLLELLLILSIQQLVLAVHVVYLMKRSKGNGGFDGFTLVELMLVISVGMLFVAMALGVITRDLSLGQAMAQRLRERGPSATHSDVDQG